MGKLFNFTFLAITLVVYLSQTNAGRNSRCPVANCLSAVQNETDSYVAGGITNRGARPCKGELIITPHLPRTFSKCHNDDIDCSVGRNRRRNRHRSTNIRVIGTCCWKIFSRDGETETFRIGEDKTPRLPYLTRIQTIGHC